jgi:hypothetical protein
MQYMQANFDCVVYMALHKKSRERVRLGYPLIECGALKMTEDNYEWGRLCATVGSSIPTALPTVPAYCIIGVIGQGSTSKVFHAIDANGREVLIKMFTKRIKSDDDSLLLEHSVFLEKAKKITAAEVANYGTLYSFFKNENDVTHKKINGHWCVVMPMFRPLTKHEQKDLDVQELIVLRLQEFEERGKRFATYDFRWRHIGWHGAHPDQKLILFDLAELEDCPPTETSSPQELRLKVSDLAKRLK